METIFISHKQTTPMELTKEIASKVKETIDCGLSSGMGNPVPGEMCIEAAVCYAYGLPHSDNPPCVGSSVRGFKIRLNDANWSSNQARAKGMRAIGIAQLNSNVLDQIEFSTKITLKIINKITANLANGELKEKLSKVDNIPDSIILCEQLAAEYAESAAEYAKSAAESAAKYANDSILIQAADLCLEVLKEMKSPGCEYLYLLDEA